MSYYVYRLKNKLDEIIYIGKTNNINARMNAHFARGHLPYECYDSVNKIEYMKCGYELEMHIKEVYYINKYKPKYNELDVCNEKRYVLNELEEDVWSYNYECPENKNSKPTTKFINIGELRYVGNYTQLPILLKTHLNANNNKKCFIHCKNEDVSEMLFERMINMGLNEDMFLITNDINDVNSIDGLYKIVVFYTANDYIIKKYKKMIPHDIDMLILRSKENEFPIVDIQMDEKYIREWVSKEEVEELIKSYDLKSHNNRSVGTRSFKQFLSLNGYTLCKKRISINGTKRTLYQIKKN